MGPFKGEVPVFARLWPVRVRVSFTWSAIIATAGLLVLITNRNMDRNDDKEQND